MVECCQDSEPYNKMVSTVCLNTLILMFNQMEDFHIFVSEFSRPNLSQSGYWLDHISLPIDIASRVMSLE